ncbi:MAG: hypothetical protein EOM26_11030 [Alphaproteobacteria bacterium]|nr:hypothetical protein [Alphaproteobacteria bacterium]
MIRLSLIPFLAVITVSIVLAGAFSSAAYAQPEQDAGVPQNLDETALEGEAVISVAPAADTDLKTDRGSLKFFDRGIPDPRDVPSLFFTPWTQTLIREYRSLPKGGKPPVDPRPIDGGSVGVAGDSGGPSGPREISLGGIAWVNQKQWTIWFNGQRVTPKGLPENVHDFSVTKDYIDVLWYDPSTNIVYPIRLRPHQRFNLDSRIFLPG